MKSTTTKQNQVALFLASGFTKKEVATKLHKSENTIRRQTDEFYKKTGCRNLADLTRFVVTRYSGIHVNDILINAMKDITVISGLVLFSWIISQPGALTEITNGLLNWIK
jgi:DNA-binding CsgD family transcriptional regulator